MPGGQWHAVRSALTMASQRRHAVLPANGASVPLGHGVQADAMSVSAYAPAGHGVHWLMPEDEGPPGTTYMPRGQGTHTSSTKSGVAPGAHAHACACGVPTKKAGQFTHAVPPAAGANVSRAHGTHARP